MILSTTLLIVIITVIVNGGSTMSILNWLGVPTGVLEDPGTQDSREMSVLHFTLIFPSGENEPIVNSPLHGYHTVEEGSENSERPAPARWIDKTTKNIYVAVEHNYYHRQVI